MYRSLYTGSIPTQMPPHAYTEWKGAYAGVFLIRCLRVCLRRVLCWMAIPGASNRTQISVFSGISVLGTENLEEDGNSRRGRKFVLGCFRNLNSHLNFHEPFLGSHYEKLV